MPKIFDKVYPLLKSHKEVNYYSVYKVATNANEIILSYFFEDSSSTWIENREVFDKFPQRYEVESGGWYGKNGRWKTLKQIYREMQCLNISNIQQMEVNSGSKIVIEKKRFTNKISVQVHSEKVSSVKFHCTEVALTDFFEVHVFDIKQNEFVDASNIFEGGLAFTGSLQDLE